MISRERALALACRDVELSEGDQDVYLAWKATLTVEELEAVIGLLTEELARRAVQRHLK